MITITVPPQIEHLTGGRHQLFIQIKETVKDPTIGDLLDCMEREAPGIKSALLNHDGSLKTFISMFIGTTPVSTLLKERSKRIEKQANLADIPLNGFEEIVIMPSISKTKQKP